VTGAEIFYRGNDQFMAVAVDASGAVRKRRVARSSAPLPAPETIEL